MVDNSQTPSDQTETDFTIGPSAIQAYSRLPYTMWHALAEFVDNSTQSRLNYESIIDDVLLDEGKSLQVDITYNRVAHEMRIEDNSIGMSHDKLIDALKIAMPTADSRGRSRYGMGMKTAACWLGRKWKIVTCEWGSGIEWTATIDVDAIARHGAKVPLTSRAVDSNCHYTNIIVTDLRRVMQKRTEDTLITYLGSIYMYDLTAGPDNPLPLRLTYNTIPIQPAAINDWDTDHEGNPFYREIPEGTMIGTKSLSGYIGVLMIGKGSRKFGGFSLYQNRRQIQGYPNGWKPSSIFGGVDAEGANNLVAQRLTGVLQPDSAFGVSHTKDAIQFEGDEEDQLENFLYEFSKDYREYAAQRRSNRAGKGWTPEKLRDLVASTKMEFSSIEMKDAINTSHLPPIDAILATNEQRIQAVANDETATVVPVTQELTVKVIVRAVSDYEPYVTISSGAEPGVVYVLINGLHPYYHELETDEAIKECIQSVYVRRGRGV